MPIVASIGGDTITKLDLERTRSVLAAYGTDTIPPDAALVRLVNEALERAVAKSLDILPSPAEVTSFNSHVDNTTKAPGILKRIKDVYGDDTITYARWYLEPKLIANNLRAFQAYDSVVQQDARRRIERAYGLLKDGSDMESTARAVDGAVILDTLSQRAGNESEIAEETEDPMRDLVAIVQELQPGQIYPTIVETVSTVRILRLQRRIGEQSVIQMLAVRKEPYEAWFRRVADTIHVEIHGPEIVDRIHKTYPDLWWLSGSAGS